MLNCPRCGAFSTAAGRAQVSGRLEHAPDLTGPREIRGPSWSFLDQLQETDEVKIEFREEPHCGWTSFSVSEFCRSRFKSVRKFVVCRRSGYSPALWSSSNRRYLHQHLDRWRPSRTLIVQRTKKSSLRDGSSPISRMPQNAWGRGNTRLYLRLILCTARVRELIDAYERLGLNSIHMRPVHYQGSRAGARRVDEVGDGMSCIPTSSSISSKRNARTGRWVRWFPGRTRWGGYFPRAWSSTSTSAANLLGTNCVLIDR